jgi:hypothetical protein
MVREITVIPAEGGWAVRSDGFVGDMMFLSGAKAERAAQRLADAMARSGESAEIRILLRDGAVAGRFLRPAEPRVISDDRSPEEPRS